MKVKILFAICVAGILSMGAVYGYRGGGVLSDLRVSGGLLSFSNPTLTLGKINLSSQVTGTLPWVAVAHPTTLVGYGITDSILSAESFTGSTAIYTLGTITVGVWHGTALVDAYIASASTWNAKQSALTSNIDYIAPPASYGVGDILIVTSLSPTTFGVISKGTSTNAILGKNGSGTIGWYQNITLNPVTAITSAPSYTGQFAVVSDVGYLATGITATTDWKQITN